MPSSFFKPIPEKIHSLVKEFSFPRLVNTDGEKKAQLLLFHKMKKKGFAPEVESFSYNIRDQILTNIKFFAISLLLLIIILSIFYNWFLIILIFSVSLFIFFFNPYFDWININLKNFIRKMKILKQKASKNFIIKRKCVRNQKYSAKIGLILLTANYDTISYRFSGKFFKFIKNTITIPILLLSSSILDIFGFFVFKFFKNQIFTEIFRYLLISVNTLTLLFVFSILLNQIENKSPGASDNASGCAVLLTLIRRIKDMGKNLEWCDLRTIFFGARNIGAIGSIEYFKNHLQEISEYKDIYIINIDKIGSKIEYWTNTESFNKKKKTGLLSELIKHHATSLNLNLKKTKHKRTILEYSNIPKKLRNSPFKICSITSNDIKLPLGVFDTYDKVDKNILVKATELIYNLILTLDQRIRDKIESGE